MKARRLTGDIVHGLPPGNNLPAFHIDHFPGAPKDWIRTDPKYNSASYIIPIPNDSETAFWFDWTKNNHLNTAILASVKGINPITGLALEGPILEEYKNKCPVHNIEFSGDIRFCKQCNYSWPPQNYICHPNVLWWDGFRQQDGKVRQFFFTTEERRDIASLIIGKHNVVPAFGFIFYKPKEPRIVNWIEIEEQETVHYKWYSGPGGQCVCKLSNNTVDRGGAGTGGPNYVNVSSTTKNPEELTNVIYMSNESSTTMDFMPIARSVGKQVKSMKSMSVSIGAGAQINQDLLLDDLGLDKWKAEPEAIIRLYFCFVDQFQEILAKGFDPLKGQSEGFLDKLPIG
jgi:hypothetical protein